MSEELDLLQAEIRQDLDAIRAAFEALNSLSGRPPVISRQLYTNLDELRRFRHLFRNAYLLRFDPDRLALVIRDARRVEALYESELELFLHFLDQLARS
jgi:hypothetical protein